MPCYRKTARILRPGRNCPPGMGSLTLEKFTRDPGIDPIYLAKMSYADDAVLDRVIDTFGLVPTDTEDCVSSFATELPDDIRPNWFVLDGYTDVYVFPSGEHEYVCNLWVNPATRLMIIERSWW